MRVLRLARRLAGWALWYAALYRIFTRNDDLTGDRRPYGGTFVGGWGRR